MYKTICLWLAFLTVLLASDLSAQIRQISLSGTYAPIIGTIDIAEKYRAAGAALEYEHKLGNHVSFGLEVDWQKYHPETVYVKAYQKTNLILIKYSIERYQLNIRPIFRYYWKEGFKGFYAGIFGVYASLTTRPKEGPMVSGYPSRTSESAFKSAKGLGLTYGYRFKLTTSLKLSAFGNHQLVYSNINDIVFSNEAHQNHQFGLGLNWAF